MITIYGSEMCPSCIVCKKNFDTNNIEYEFKDITKNLHFLKEFLIYRDRESAFDRAKEIHHIGIPAIVKEDGTVFTDWETFLIEKGLKVIKEDDKKSCSITKKGC